MLYRHGDAFEARTAIKPQPTAKELIAKAIPLIEGGWCRLSRSVANPDGGYSYCLRGALFEASGLGRNCVSDYASMTAIPDAEEEILNATRLIDDDPADESQDIVNWNDSPYRTKAHVLDAMRVALL